MFLKQILLKNNILIIKIYNLYHKMNYLFLLNNIFQYIKNIILLYNNMKIFYKNLSKNMKLKRYLEVI